MAITQRSLYKTIEKIGDREYANEEDMLIAVLDEIVRNDRININGGRLWKLEPAEKMYRLEYESGNIEKVGTDFRISLKEYAVFNDVAKRRTVVARETNRTLRSRGITKYSATGIGETVQIGKLHYYEYLMAFNAQSHERDTTYLLSIAGQAASHLLRNRRSEHEVQALQSEMALASDLQRRILPQHEFSFGDFDLYGICLPERTVGGDFFNYYKLPGFEDRIGVAIGDAASKGMPAAVQALFVSGALMMSVEFEAMMSSTLRRLNTINRAIFPNDRIMSLFYCQLYDGNEGLMLYSNAGHPSPVHYHASSRSCGELISTGPVLGLLEDASYGISNRNIAPGDILVLYTDGITEANNGTDEFGEERVMRCIERNAGESAKNIARLILEEVQIFSANGLYSDDKTVVVIKRK